MKKVFKILPLRQIATQRRNFETHAMMDCRCYGQHSLENGSRNGNRTQKGSELFLLVQMEEIASYLGRVIFFLV